MAESGNVGAKLHYNESSPTLASPSVVTPSPSEKQKIRKRPNNGIDANKTPKQRPKMKRHRPKVAIDHIHGRQLRKAPNTQTPKRSTPKPKTPKRTYQRAKIRSANKIDLKGLGSTAANVNTEAFFASPTPTCVAVSGTRSLNFDIEEVEHRDDVEKECSGPLDYALANQETHDLRNDKIEASFLSRTPTRVPVSCRRSLNFDIQEVGHRDDVKILRRGSLDFTLDNLEKCDFLRSVTTSKRSVRKRRIFIRSNSHTASENFDNHVNELHSDLKIECRELGDHCSRRFVYQYQRRKQNVERSLGLDMSIEECTSSSRSGTESMVENPHGIEREAVCDSRKPFSTTKTVCLQFYRRRYRVNQCRQNSRKIGPIFPKMWKRSRRRRQRATTFATMWSLTGVESGERKVKRAYDRSGQTSGRTLSDKLYSNRVQYFETSRYQNPTSLVYDFHSRISVLQMILPTQKQAQAALADPESFKCVLSLNPLVASRRKRFKGFIRRRIFTSSTLNFNFVQSPSFSLGKDMRSLSYGSEDFEPQLIEEVPLLESEYYTNWNDSTMGFSLSEAVAYDSEMMGQLPRDTQTFVEVPITESESYKTLNTMNFFLDDAMAYGNGTSGGLLPEHNSLEVAVYDGEKYPPQHKDVMLPAEGK